MLSCPIHKITLRQVRGNLICPVCGEVGRIVDGVASFLPNDDPFYEGRYNNCVKFLPASDGFLSTLPLRIVMQGYPTTVAQEIDPGARVVEVGCAGGIRWFGHRFRMIGLDLSRTALRSAAETYETVVQCDATQMPLADASADAVVSSCLFEHLTQQQKSLLLREAHRVLRPGGKLVFFCDVETDNPVIAHYRSQCPELYQSFFLDHDGHVGYEGIDVNRWHYRTEGLRIVREVFHECTPFLSTSVWEKLSRWPGKLGRLASVARMITSGSARLPALAVLTMIDASVGRLLPHRFARCVTTIAVKP